MPMRKIVPGDPETRSADVIDENIERLKSLFPEACTEGKIDFDVLRQILGDSVDEREERYELNWHGKRRARQLALTPSTGTLRPCPEESVGWDTTQNLMIEGDNLEVLKLLQKSYAGKVKLIYIDPPYNTGKDFIYADDFRAPLSSYLEMTGQADKERVSLTSNADGSGRFHTAWLSMLYPRLHLARSLLRKDGLVFVSVDQVELANLKHVMDDVFGGENFFAILTRRAMHTVRNSSKDFNLHADYLVVYGRQKAWFGEQKSRYIRATADKTGGYRHDDNDGRGPYKLDPLHARNYYTPYDHCFSNGVTWSAPEGSYPRYAQATLECMEEDGRIHFGNGQPMAKRYLGEVQVGVPPNTILSPEKVGFNFDGTQDLQAVLGKDKVFPQPKPTKLIRHLLDLCDDTESVVLDFFAGSGTTAHAVWAENVNDKGRRRFILVQMPEPILRQGTQNVAALEYCRALSRPPSISEITKERLRRTGGVLQESSPADADLGFRVYKLDTSSFRTWAPDPVDLEGSLLTGLDHIKGERSEQDVLTEILLKLGLDLCVPVEERMVTLQEREATVYSVGAGTLMACLAGTITRADVEPLGQVLADWHDEQAPVGDATVIFRDSAFVDDVAKTNLVALLEQHGLGNVRSV